MMNKNAYLPRPFSGNTLKLIAALSMLFDHIGVILFPGAAIFKRIGRLAFPLFAFFIAEGCYHTRNRLRYFLTMSLLAVIIQAVYYIAMRSLYMSVFVTFSLSMLLLYALDECKRAFLEEKSSTLRKITSVLLFLLLLLFTYWLNTWLDIDYGFWGCVTPLFVGLFRLPKGSEVSKKWQFLNSRWISLCMLTVALLLMALGRKPIQHFSFLSIPLLCFYSGERGKYKLKYFFYLFYPLHLVLLYGIYYFFF